MLKGSKQWAVMHPVSKLVLAPFLKRSVQGADIQEDGTIVDVDPNDIKLQGTHSDFKKLQWWKVDLQVFALEKIIHFS
jgi:hypothetical protein